MKVRDMYFANIISGNSGSVVLSPENGIESISGNVALETKGGTFSSAIFEVTDGLGNNPFIRHFYTGFSITLPSNDVLLVNENGQTMRVSNFTSNASTAGYGRFKDGDGLLSIGATLYVSSNQGLGNYASSAPFPITVNFY